MTDVAIPSVEGGSSTAMTPESPELPGQVSSRAPRVTLTPAPSSSAHSTPRISESGDVEENTSQVRRPGPTEELSRDMQQMQLSSPDRMDMNTVAAAIDSIAQESSPRTSVRTDEAANENRGSASRRNSRMRRLSSRSVLELHDVESEEPPQDAFNEPSFQNALRNTTRLMADVARELESSSLHNDPDSVMHRLRNEARDLANFRCPSTRIVAFVGESGTGKSSLLNSLLDFKDLARTSGSGTACTSVATEYHFHQSQYLTVEMELFSMDEYAEQLKDMLLSYRYFKLHQSDIETGVENNDREDRDQLQDKATLAQDTFRSMFRGRLDDEAFLLTNPETSVLETLESWTADLIQSESTAPRSGLTLENCSALLAKLSSDQSSSNEPAIWPCIRKIKVFLNAHILKKGLVLVDLPGLRDLNSARRNVTERFLRHCDEIFVTCDIVRATTDQGVRDVFDLAGRAGLSRVGIICTKSDVIVPNEAVRDHDRRRAQEIRRRMEDLDDKVRTYIEIENEWQELAALPTLSIHDQEDLNDLSRDKIQAALDKYIIELRNEDVTQALAHLYGPSAPTAEVAVFCVSNTLYIENRVKAKNEALPYLNLSGIMAVRRHCIAIVSTSQQLAAANYMRHKVPGLLAQIQLWIQSGAGSAGLELRKELLRALETVETWLRRDLTSRTSAAQTVGTVLKQRFDETLYYSRDTPKWSQAAQNAAEKWQGWSPPTYSAFCRNYGIHSTEGAGGWHNWNQEAIEGMAEDVGEPWRALGRILMHQQGIVIRLIKHVLDRVVSHLESQPDALGDVVLPLTQALESHLNLAIGSVEEAYENLEVGLSSLQADALSGIRTSFIGTAMEASYRECNLDHGRGSDGRRKAIIRRRFGHDRLFPDLMRAWRQGFRDLADGMQDDMKGIICSTLIQIRQMLDIVRRENAANEGERDAAFRDRVNGALIRAQTEHQRTLNELST